MELWLIGLLCCTGMMAGFVDSIAGGGGLIGLPVLLALGVPPHIALGTNKMQAVFGSGMACFNYRRHRLMSIRASGFGVLCTAIGATAGTVGVSYMAADFLQPIILYLLLAVFLFVLLKPNYGKIATIAKLKDKVFYLLFGHLWGFYDGFFGPGTGNFWTASYVGLKGLDLKSATAHTKLMNFTSNFCSLVAFACMGMYRVDYAVVMALGQLLGARLGSGMVIKRGTGFVRVFFLIVVAGTLAKLTSDTFWN